MKLTTPVLVEPLAEGFSFRDRIMFIGSCFAENIGNMCRSTYFDCMVNPMGILFNPCSVADCLGIIDGYGVNPYGCSFREDDAVSTPQGYCSFHHHGSFARPSVQEFLDNANSRLSEAWNFMKTTKWVVVTLGTAYVYRTADGIPVSNCHKLPEEMFTRSMLTVEQAADALEQYITADPDRQWILTVSPVRHVRDGLHANQLSKSVLLLAVSELQHRHENVHYFPSYEILLDELRDYRFCAEDMVHPSAQAVRYVWERFVDYGLRAEEKPLLERAMRVSSMMEHRTMHADSPEAQAFEERRQKEYQELMKVLRG